MSDTQLSACDWLVRLLIDPAYGHTVPLERLDWRALAALKHYCDGLRQETQQNQSVTVPVVFRCLYAVHQALRQGTMSYETFCRHLQQCDRCQQEQQALEEEWKRSKPPCP